MSISTSLCRLSAARQCIEKRNGDDNVWKELLDDVTVSPSKEPSDAKVAAQLSPSGARVAPQLASLIVLAESNPSRLPEDAAAVLESIGASSALKPWVDSIRVHERKSKMSSPKADKADDTVATGFWEELAVLMQGQSRLKLAAARRKEERAAKGEEKDPASFTEATDVKQEAQPAIKEVLDSMLNERLTALTESHCGSVVQCDTVRATSSNPALAGEGSWTLRSIDISCSHVLQSRERAPFVVYATLADRAVPFLGDVTRSSRSTHAPEPPFAFANVLSEIEADTTDDDSGPLNLVEIALVIKSDDDLRQEIVAMQLVALMNEAWATALVPTSDRSADVSSPSPEKKKKKKGLFSGFGSKKDKKGESSDADNDSDQEAEKLDTFVPPVLVRSETFGMALLDHSGNGCVEVVPESCSVHQLLRHCSSAASSSDGDDDDDEDGDEASLSTEKPEEKGKEKRSSKRSASGLTDNSAELAKYLEATVASDATRRRLLLSTLVAANAVEYLISLKDRHNANSLLTRAGAFVHVDFGFFFERAPGGMLSVERSAFKLPPAVVTAVLGGSKRSPEFQGYRRAVVRALQHLKKSAAFESAVKDALEGLHPSLLSEMSCFGGKDAEHVGEALRGRLGASRDGLYDAVNNCHNNGGRLRYDQFQRSSNGILY